MSRRYSGRVDLVEFNMNVMWREEQDDEIQIRIQKDEIREGRCHDMSDARRGAKARGETYPCRDKKLVICCHTVLDRRSLGSQRWMNLTVLQLEDRYGLPSIPPSTFRIPHVRES